MIARITRRILRKIAKPALLWLVNRQIRRAESRVKYFERLLNMSPSDVKLRVTELIGRRNQVRSW